MKRVFFSVSAFIFLLVLGWFSLFVVKEKDKKEKLLNFQVGSHKFDIEIADDILEQSRGLSGRDFLPDNRGMLFVFKDLSVRSFWMAGMKFPLDIIWIKENQVVGFSEGLPPASATNVKVYYSPESVDMVLEVNSGLVNKLGISIGDKVRFD